MLRTAINAFIFYQHTPEEVEELSRVIIPLAEHIKAVSSGFERGQMRRILGCETFREGEAKAMVRMLGRAAKHARAHLSDYFPLMRPDLIRQAEELELQVSRYWRVFEYQAHELIPVT